MTSPPFCFSCKNCGQEEEFMDYPEWWICERCLMKNIYHWKFFFKWITSVPLTNEELNKINRPNFPIVWSKKPMSYEKRIKQELSRKITKPTKRKQR